jgi:protein TonB
VAHAAESKRPPITIGSPISNSNRLITQVRPIYPEEAKKKRIQGVVSFRVLITKAGEVRDIEVLKGDPMLVPAALNAVKQWRYSPFLLNSEPVEIKTQIDINFTLNQ